MHPEDRLSDCPFNDKTIACQGKFSVAIRNKNGSVRTLCEFGCQEILETEREDVTSSITLQQATMRILDILTCGYYDSGS